MVSSFSCFCCNLPILKIPEDCRNGCCTHSEQQPQIICIEYYYITEQDFSKLFSGFPFSFSSSPCPFYSASCRFHSRLSFFRMISARTAASTEVPGKF